MAAHTLLHEEGRVQLAVEIVMPCRIERAVWPRDGRGLRHILCDGVERLQFAPNLIENLMLQMAQQIMIGD